MLKYKFKEDKYSSHSKIINLIGTNKLVLDVGCARGFIGKEIKKNNCKIVGIDCDVEAAKIAEKFYDRVIIGDLETVKFDFKENYFDIMIFGDIIEHLKNPDVILEKLRKYLKEDGSIIVSIGNIANWWIRFNLLFGRFQYEKRGILDETHLKFFTLKTIKKFIVDNGFKIKKVDAIPIPLPMVLPILTKNKLFYLPHNINYLITKLYKKLFAYQFIIKAKKY